MSTLLVKNEHQAISKKHFLFRGRWSCQWFFNIVNKCVALNTLIIAKFILGGKVLLPMYDFSANSSTLQVQDWRREIETLNKQNTPLFTLLGVCFWIIFDANCLRYNFKNKKGQYG